MRLIVSNDDFGLTFGFNKAIETCFNKGITTSASLVINGASVQNSLKLLKGNLKRISLGLHLNLTHGNSYTEELASPGGRYKYKFFDYYTHLTKANLRLIKAISKDLEIQFKISIDKYNLHISHVDGHDHIHMIPSIFKIVCALCKKYNIKYLRITREPYYSTQSLSQNLTPFINKNILKFMLLNHLSKSNLSTLKQHKLKSPQVFYGILHSNNMNNVTFESAVKNALQRKLNLAEIVLHPAFTNHPKDINYPDKTVRLFATSSKREEEMKLLTNPKVKQLIEDNNITLIGYNNLK